MNVSELKKGLEKMQASFQNCLPPTQATHHHYFEFPLRALTNLFTKLRLKGGGSSLQRLRGEREK